MNRSAAAIFPLALILPVSPLAATSEQQVAPASTEVDPSTGTIPGYTYGKTEYNHYSTWSGGFLMQWAFAAHHVGYSPAAPVAGTAFYLHAHTAVVSPHALTADVLITVDADAGGLPLRIAPTASMPLRCTRQQFDPVGGPATEVPCRDTVSVESGQMVVSRLEPLVPGFSFDVLIPVVADKAGSGTTAMTAMWAVPDVSLDNKNVTAAVPVTVVAAPVGTPSSPPPTAPAPTTTPPPARVRPLPKVLRKYTRVRSRTPKICTVRKKSGKRVVVFRKQGLCKLRASKGPGGASRSYKIRY